MSNQTDPRSLQVPRRDQSLAPDRQAAANLMRQQIDDLYAQQAQQPTDTSAAEPAYTPAPAAPTDDNPYHRTHNENAAHTATADQWEQYHSAWQKYYQLYYERYYAAQQPTAAPSVTQHRQTIDPEEAEEEIKHQLLDTIKQRLGTVRRSRHFFPIISALTVMLLFTFVQYNRVVFATVKSYVSPGAISSQNIILDPTDTTAVGPEPKVIIPKINVDAPVVYGVGSIAEGPVQNALQNGVVHYPIPGADSIPGQQGNTVLLGHSSNDVFDNGGYKFVFVQLDRLEKGDTFYLNYNGTRYTYSVINKIVIEPTEVSKLQLQHDAPLATLVTCTPPGTALQRLVIFGEQISPSPRTATAAPAPSQSESPAPGNIAGNSPTLLERLFGN